MTLSDVFPKSPLCVIKKFLEAKSEQVTGSFTDLDQGSEMIVSESIWTAFEASSSFLGS